MGDLTPATEVENFAKKKKKKIFLFLKLLSHSTKVSTLRNQWFWSDMEVWSKVIVSSRQVTRQGVNEERLSSHRIH